MSREVHNYELIPSIDIDEDEDSNNNNKIINEYTDFARDEYF